MSPTVLTLRLPKPSSMELFLSKVSEKRLVRNQKLSHDTSKIQWSWDGLDGRSRSISILDCSSLLRRYSPERYQVTCQQLVFYLSGLASLCEEVRLFRTRESTSAS